MTKKFQPKLKTPEYRLSLPISKKELVYRPYNVNDERLLIAAATAKDKDASFYIDNTLSVLKNVVLNDIVVENLPSVEVKLLMLALRGKSVGEEIEFTYDNTPYVVNADEFYINVPEDDFYKIELDENTGLVMKNISFADEVSYVTKHKDTPSDAIYSMIVDCVAKVYDGEEVWNVGEDVGKQEVADFIFGLTGHSQKLYEFIKNMPVISVDATNTNTGEKITITSKEVDFLS